MNNSPSSPLCTRLRACLREWIHTDIKVDYINELFFCRELDKFIQLFGCHGKRFFADDMLPRQQRGFRMGMMKVIWRGEMNDINMRVS